eukprot:1192589-Prorocentrum_minimum.AAC.1
MVVDSRRRCYLREGGEGWGTPEHEHAAALGARLNPFGTRCLCLLFVGTPQETFEDCFAGAVYTEGMPIGATGWLQS